ncbi:hypothetical protein Rleg2_1144 [Rhizobium leguminosarum bv. trifolii WSM2304]|uniref:Uncharacterized protein n=1 Tax=Rhizobium leguminosarum bv. trifolii (strain WSM2304) TaxID=395492 RepID=A0ABF7QK68_RHILW|nr:hypothetical protein [Rhizobium leguminosarum]ACI54438.1 hypothetical protein Rleg2_1144 [Rhizobium leguminosarum bv. trifolii WSM2304]
MSPDTTSTTTPKAKPQGKDLLEKARNEEGGYTLIPAKKAQDNDTVEVVEPLIEDGAMVVAKRK